MFVFFFGSLPTPSEASGESWLSTYGYRKKITIGNATGAGVNYQINITVNKGAGSDSGYNCFLDSNCTDFPNDIAFTDNDGDTVLRHWSRTVDANTEVFWFLLTDNLNTTAQEAYIYYGKAGQASTNDFIRTFIFGDPFDNATLNTNIWPSITGGPHYTINTGSNYLEVTDMTEGWASGFGFHSNTTLVYPYSYIVQDAYGGTNGVYHYVWTGGVNTVMSAMGISVHHVAWTSADMGVGFARLGDHWAGSDDWAVIAGVGGNSDYGSGAGGAPPKTTYFEIIKPNGTIYIDESGTNRVTEANSESPDRFHILLSRFTGRAFGTQRVGAFLIRKYVDPEPRVTAWGATEDNKQPPENRTCIITNIETGNNVYPPEKYYIFQATSRDNDTNLVNITVAFTDGASWGNATFQIDTDTWTRIDGLDIIVLNASACTNATVGNTTIANFHIRFREEVQEANLIDIYLRSVDADGNADDYEVVNNNYFNIVKGVELIEYSSSALLFYLCIFVILLSLAGMKWGLVGWTGFILACAILIPNILDPSGNPIMHSLMYWTIFISFALNLLSTGIRFKNG